MFKEKVCGERQVIWGRKKVLWCVDEGEGGGKFVVKKRGGMGEGREG